MLWVQYGHIRPANGSEVASILARLSLLAFEKGYNYIIYIPTKKKNYTIIYKEKEKVQMIVLSNVQIISTVLQITDPRTY